MLLTERAFAPRDKAFIIKPPIPFPGLGHGGASVIDYPGYVGACGDAEGESHLPEGVLREMTATSAWIYERQWIPHLKQIPAAEVIPTPYQIYVMLPNDQSLSNVRLLVTPSGARFHRKLVGEKHIAYAAPLANERNRLSSPFSGEFYQTPDINKLLDRARNKDHTPGGTAWVPDFKAPDGQLYRMLPDAFRSHFSVKDPNNVDPITGRAKDYWFPSIETALFLLDGSDIFYLPPDLLELKLHESVHCWRMAQNMPWPENEDLESRYVAFPSGEHLERYLEFMDQFKLHPWVERIHKRFRKDWRSFRYGFIGEGEAFGIEMLGTRALVEDEIISGPWDNKIWQQRANTTWTKVQRLLSDPKLSGIPAYKVYGVLTALAFHESASSFAEVQDIISAYSQLLDYKIPFVERLVTKDYKLTP